MCEENVEYVRAYVRKPGAGGVFYPVDFLGIRTKAEWFDKCNNDWELEHFEYGTPPE